MTEEMKVGGVKKAECSACGGTRNCEVLGYHSQGGSEAEYYHWNKGWYLLVCRGCENVFAQTISTNSEDYNNYYNEIGDEETDYIETVNYWPALSKREKPEWMSDAGIEASLNNIERLNASLLELYGALDNDLNMLAAIGLRTTFDIASELLGVDQNKTFAAKLRVITDKGFIRAAEREHLSVLVEAGSASAHRGWKPTAEDLSTLMDILESFIRTAFVDPDRKERSAQRIAKIKAKVPGRAIVAPIEEMPKPESDGEANFN